MLPGVIVALAAEKKSKDTFYLLKIDCAKTVKDYDDTGSFGNTVAKGTKHLEEYFLDSYNGKRGQYSTRKVAYPFVQVTEGKKALSNDEFLLLTIIKIIIENSGCTIVVDDQMTVYFASLHLLFLV